MLRSRKRYTKISSLFIFSIFLYSCMPPAEKKLLVYNSQESPSAKTSEFSRLYELSKTQDYELENAFNDELEASSAAVLGKTEKGYFSYSLKPEGAIYPFARVRVNCVFSSDISKEKAAEICARFFGELDRRHKLLKEKVK